MAKKNSLSRTVQYWRLVDARTEKWVDEYDWENFLRQLYKKDDFDNEFDIDGIPLSGKIHSVKASNYSLLTSQLSQYDLPYVYDEDSAFTVVLSSSKDYTPNQKNSDTGNQAPMRLNGDEWEPVDNLFIYHLPFANMIAVMAESVSSKRAKVYAEWLNRVMIQQGLFKNDPDFRWTATPVVDPHAIQKIKNADRLKSVVVAGQFGNQVKKELSPLSSIFGQKLSKDIDGIRLEIKVSTVRGHSTQADEEKILDWYDDTFGSFQQLSDGSATTARVTAAENNSSYTEVDLINQRITRKRSVALNHDGAAVISYSGATEAILDATANDFETLWSLRQ
ncbi:hypothetical protein QP920_10365 [Corynebacterium marquesiae]|uniref:hypothetical protein n=1 Tax=Corynebacterium marquesiae TaxID=2913503 RepID=UPI00254F9AFE|nr:hypothetical protein [Corynebacterium marquesiae]MDK8496845.1 hypothetical protein [Corynebacterium marquesiae]